MSAYEVFAVGETERLPESAWAPDHPAEAVQVEAFVEDHVSIEEFPIGIEVGEAVNEIAGTGFGFGSTVTVTDFVTAPQEPVQFAVYVVVTVGLTDFVPPELARDPGQNGSFGFDVVLHPYIPADDGDHVMSEEVSPEVIVLGTAVKINLSSFGFTGTVIDWETLPPNPVQVSVKTVGDETKNFN